MAAIEILDREERARTLPFWAQAICVLWPIVALFRTFLGWFVGMPNMSDPVPIAVISGILICLLAGCLTLRKGAYGVIAFFSLLCALYELTSPFMTYNGLISDLLSYAFAVWYAVTIIAAIICIRSVPSSPNAMRLRSVRLAIFSMTIVFLIGAALFAQSFETPKVPAGTRLASKNDLMGEWYGVKTRNWNVRPGLAVERINFLPGGRGGEAYGLRMKAPPGRTMCWLMRGHRLHLSVFYTDAWAQLAYTPIVSEDGKSLWFANDTPFGVKIYYRSDTPEGKKLHAFADQQLKNHQD